VEDQYITTILWRHKALVALCLIAGIGAAIAATLLRDKVYEARSTLRAGALVDRNGGDSPEANQALARSYAEVLTSGSFLERIRHRVAGGTLSVRELQDRLKADAITDTGVIRLKARGSSPAAARGLAGAVTTSFLATLQEDATQRVTRQQAEIDALVERLNRRMEAARRDSSALAQLRASRQALLEQGAGLVADGVAEAGSVRRVGPPSASSKPVSPRPLLNATAGILLGLLLGAGLAWWRERRAPGLHSAEEAAALIDVPLLAAIPLRRRVLAGDPSVVESYDLLRANLTFQSLDRGLCVVTVAGKNVGVGKTSTVEGLAFAAARSGSSVVVVDGDLRRGSLSQRLGHGGREGLCDLVCGGRSLDDVLVELAPGVALLPSNAPTPNPPSLLYSQRARDAINELRDRFDLVLIDSPPVAQLADGLILASLSDGVLIVARSGVTTGPDLQSGVTKIRQARVPLVGLVFFTPLSVDTTYYYPRTGDAGPRADDAALSR
jgi:capsular exopolysaccharide synthesis family protein